jgi:hypothetical protein
MYRQQFRKWKEVKVDECRGDGIEGDKKMFGCGALGKG